jgi:hypothetical protein
VVDASVNAQVTKLKEHNEELQEELRVTRAELESMRVKFSAVKSLFSM